MDTPLLQSQHRTDTGFPLWVLGKYALILLSIGLLMSALLIRFLNTATASFPIHTDIVIQEGTSISKVADMFAKSSIVRSSFMLSLALHYYFPHEYIQSGIYRFEQPLTTYEIADVITHGTHKAPLIKITFPEGFRASDIYKYLPENFIRSDNGAVAESQEGFLFPDTYFIHSNITFSDLLVLMRKNFELQIQSLDLLFASSTLSEREVITLASIVEREARDETSMKIVAGILRNRLKNDMPLQVDATFEYLLGKTSAELSQTDLATDSPYNTYRNKGIPPHPISNPGLIAIRAVLEPTQTDYLYYLTDRNGIFHYAKTFGEHKINKLKYLP